MIDTYIDSFAGPPWFENWKSTQVEAIVSEALKNDGFVGKVALRDRDNYIVGASFGYRVPEKDTETVKFSEIYCMLKEIGWEDAFYGAETFIRRAYQKQGVGTQLLREFAEQALCDKVVFRTKNLNQIKARERAWNCKVKKLFYDPVEKERMWYGVANGNK